MGFWDDAEVISVYTRAQAIEDGALVDVSHVAKEAGFVWPVAMTTAAWADCVEWDEANHGLQDEQGRLWDVLWMAFCAVKTARRPGERLRFSLLRVPNTPRATVARMVELDLHVGPGDLGEPVLTIMTPNEN